MTNVRKKHIVYQLGPTFDKIHRHLQSIGVHVAIVEDMCTQRHILGPSWPEVVDPVDGVQHDLHGLHAPLRHDWAAGDFCVALVDHVKAADQNVPGDVRGPLQGPGQVVVGFHQQGGGRPSRKRKQGGSTRPRLPRQPGWDKHIFRVWDDREQQWVGEIQSVVVAKMVARL